MATDLTYNLKASVFDELELRLQKQLTEWTLDIVIKMLLLQLLLQNREPALLL